MITTNNRLSFSAQPSTGFCDEACCLMDDEDLDNLPAPSRRLRKDDG
jgi:hypothetical protein